MTNSTGRDLVLALEDLVNKYGLEVVHETLRDIGDYCENCGCPLIEGETHSPYGSMGSCYVQRPLHAT